jgi:hypothetical protein
MLDVDNETLCLCCLAEDCVLHARLTSTTGSTVNFSRRIFSVHQSIVERACAIETPEPRVGLEQILELARLASGACRASYSRQRFLAVRVVCILEKSMKIEPIDGQHYP